jgi:hypothetical protein
MKKRYFLGLVLFFIIALPSSHSLSGEVTGLSRKATDLKAGMSRKSVISLIGHPTWAVIPGDKGDLSLPDPGIKIELYWKNTPCSPIVVQFGNAHKVTGWDEGRAFCGEAAHLLEPSNEYSCSKADRSKLCK